MPQQRFKSRLEGMGPKKAWCFLPVPFDVKAVFGQTRVAVRGTVNGFAFRSTIQTMAGKNFIMFNKQLRAGSGARAGDTVKVVLEADDQPRTVKLPPYLSKALGRNQKARDAYQKLAYSHKKRFVDWVADAKQEETRQRRIAKMTAMLLAGETFD